jgi:hypothetical protein
MADVWSGSFDRTASISLCHDADDEIAHASDDSIAQSAWDEVFRTLAAAPESQLAGSCSEAL